MKILSIFALLIALIISPAHADDELTRKNMLIDPDVTLSWVAPTTRVDGTPLDDGEIAGYRFYFAVSGDQLSLLIDLPSDTLSYQTIVIEGVTHYAVTAYNTDGVESDFSVLRGVIGFTPKPPSAPILSIR